MFQNRAFSSLFWAQFLGAFNDNLFKNALSLLITFRSAELLGLSPAQLVALSGGLFILPFFFASAFAGQLADRFPKDRLIQLTKLAEIGVMLIGGAGFWLNSLPLLLVALFLIGAQATFFGPLKYGVLPEISTSQELTSANAKIELGTFLAILLGTITAGLLLASGPNGPVWAGVATVVVAIAGAIAAQRMPRLLAQEPELPLSPRPLRSTWAVLRLAKEQESVFQSILGISWFWLLGAAVIAVLPELAKVHLAGQESTVTLLLALFSLGIGAGSILAAKLSHRQLELGLVPIGSLGITVFLGDAGWVLFGSVPSLSSPAGARLMIDLTVFAVFAGLYIVPLYTLIQERSRPGVRSQVIAANNVMNAAFMVVGAALLMGLFAAGMSIPGIFVTLALMNLAVALYIYQRVPEFALRFACWMIAHAMYRLRVVGQGRIPTAGPLVLVSNHVTFVDWMIISAASPRPMRFVMHHSFLKLPGAGWLFRDAKVIPIAGQKEDAEVMEAAFDAISIALRAGEIVCIFPEGKLSTDGAIAPFRRGIERIVSNDPVPVVCVHLGGLWGSFFSLKDGAPLRRPFRRFWSRVRLEVGEVVDPKDASAARVEEEVRRLGGETIPGSALAPAAIGG